MGFDMLDAGRQVLASQPFSQFLAAQLTAFAPGSAVIEVPITPALTQQFGYVHGGVISYAADNALTFAGGSQLGTSVLTSEYKINYVKPARGERLSARASVIATSSRQATCRCDVWAINGAEEYLCATALGTIVKLSTEPGS